ncbi:MAG: L-threonylcarbamoyladenylate synthase [Nitrospirota bacterium]
MILSYKKDSLDNIIVEMSGVINSGGIIAYPTESFYALGVSVHNDNAVKRLFELKGRSPEKPLPLIVGDMSVLLSVVKYVPDRAGELIKRFWPGPLTLVLEARDCISPLLTGGTGKAAVRIPGESAALYIARAIRNPITATSANFTAQPPAETAWEVISYFDDKIDLIIDAGRSPGGKPSTIVDVTVDPPKVLRAGSVLLDL